MSYLDKCVYKTDLLMNKLKPSQNIILFVLNKHVYLAYTLSDLKEIMKSSKNHYVKRKNEEPHDTLQTFFYLPHGIVIDNSLQNCFYNKVNTMSVVKSDRQFRIGFGDNEHISDFYSVQKENRDIVSCDEPSFFNEEQKQEYSDEESEIQIDWTEVKKQEEKRREIELLREEKKWYDEVFCLEAIKQDVLNFQFVKNQTDAICLKAVKQDGTALKYVKNQTDVICLTAFKQDGMALKYVKNQTDAIAMEAVKRNGNALEFVKNQTEAMCLEAVKEWGETL
jgi:hypothetical protein